MNNKVKAKWGILGTAKIAREALIPGLRDSNSSKLAAIASKNKEKAKEFAEKFNVPKSYGSYEELLNDNQLEFVYIPLPNHLHTKWSIKAAREHRGPLLGPEESINNARALEAIRESAEKRDWVEV